MRYMQISTFEDYKGFNLCSYPLDINDIKKQTKLKLGHTRHRSSGELDYSKLNLVNPNGMKRN